MYECDAEEFMEIVPGVEDQEWCVEGARLNEWKASFLLRLQVYKSSEND